MRYWPHCNRQGKLNVFSLKSLCILTTVLMLFTLISVLRSTGPDQEESTVYDEKLLDVIYNNNVLRAKLEQLRMDEENIGDVYSQSILNDLDNMMVQMHALESHYQERSIKYLMSQPILNNHNFTYIHSPLSTCTGAHVDLIIAVPSAASNFEKRRKARNGGRNDYVKNPSNKAKMLFFLARTFDRSIQARIESEVKEFGDIVQENFEDIYRNNRLKSVSILRWVSTYCSNTKYVIRSDDDINVNISALMPVIDRTATKFNHFILGHKLVGDPPVRRWRIKYYMSRKEYPLSILPPYLLGGLLAFPVSTAKILYEAALRIKPIWLEDVYITGVCTAVLHVPILTDQKFHFEHFSP